jgi:cytochrome c oxidase cbb3-type subunit 1
VALSGHSGHVLAPCQSVTQGLMWRSVEPDGTLTYSFVESVKASYPYYYVRLVGGLLYFGGMLIMAWNVAMTVLGSKPVDAPVLAAPAYA